MAKVTIEEQGCRGCSMCADICPVDVFDYDEGTHLATVTRTEDCIGCFSCFYVCPSQCVGITEVEEILPFHRIEENMALVERFLQMKTATGTLGADECAAALKDVSVRLSALANAVTETMGRGQKAVGRKAGTVAAIHFPEMYEGRNIEEVMERMQQRFKHSFDFDFQVSDRDVDLTFHPCGLKDVVEGLGEKVGEAVLCQLFHEYWAGVLGAFTNNKYQAVMDQVGDTCKMKLAAAAAK